MNSNKLYRDEQHKMIGGVCAGLAEYFAVDVSIIRIIFLLAFFMKGSGVLLYIILWIVLPPKGITWNQPGVNYTTPPDPANPADPSIGDDPVIMPEPQNVPRRRSGAAVITGVVLIVLGTLLLIDEYGLIPDFDFGHLWPIVVIALGITVIVTSLKNKSSNTKPPVI